LFRISGYRAKRGINQLPIPEIGGHRKEIKPDEGEAVFPAKSADKGRIPCEGSISAMIGGSVTVELPQGCNLRSKWAQRIVQLCAACYLSETSG